jgi:hypothetical protein
MYFLHMGLGLNLDLVLDFSVFFPETSQVFFSFFFFSNSLIFSPVLSPLP